MVLRTLEMQGFKSFPDKTVLNFGKGITAVVGPNGSGKSNISDAVRWVLGETSTKSLRGSKMEDVIFGGTSARKALGFAQVQLTLDNSDGTLKDRGEIVTVTRRYYRSGESEYKIDGEQVRSQSGAPPCPTPGARTRRRRWTSWKPTAVPCAPAWTRHSAA